MYLILNTHSTHIITYEIESFLSQKIRREHLHIRSHKQAKRRILISFLLLSGIIFHISFLCDVSSSPKKLDEANRIPHFAVCIVLNPSARNDAKKIENGNSIKWVSNIHYHYTELSCRQMHFSLFSPSQRRKPLESVYSVHFQCARAPRTKYIYSMFSLRFGFRFFAGNVVAAFGYRHSALGRELKHCTREYLHMKRENNLYENRIESRIVKSSLLKIEIYLSSFFRLFASTCIFAFTASLCSPVCVCVVRVHALSIFQSNHYALLFVNLCCAFNSSCASFLILLFPCNCTRTQI